MAVPTALIVHLYCRIMKYMGECVFHGIKVLQTTVLKCGIANGCGTVGECIERILKHTNKSTNHHHNNSTQQHYVQVTCNTRHTTDSSRPNSELMVTTQNIMPTTDSFILLRPHFAIHDPDITLQPTHRD